MQHVGDLQPLDRPFSQSDRASAGRYSAKRSRWRLAIGSLEIGFDRASEKIHAEIGRKSPSVAQRLLMVFGMICVSLLVVALAGWLWSARGPVLGGDSVSAAIVQRDVAGDASNMSAMKLGAPASDRPLKAAAERPPVLRAVIETRPASPALAPARQASVEIAQGHAFAPRPAAALSIGTTTPDDAIVQSGNFLLIPPVERAVATAMSSGEAQSWTAGDYHGVVVVSDASPKDGQSCRSGTILLRDGSTKGRTQSFDRCL